MARVRGVNTRPEMIVRRAAHRLGYRFRLHVRTLPGVPDIVFSGRRKVIFVHGCFWHGHRCRAGRLPKSRGDYWGPKIAGNRTRDARSIRALRATGWSVAVFWQCQLRDPDALESRIQRFLSS